MLLFSWGSFRVIWLAPVPVIDSLLLLVPFINPIGSKYVTGFWPSVAQVFLPYTVCFEFLRSIGNQTRFIVLASRESIYELHISLRSSQMRYLTFSTRPWDSRPVENVNKSGTWFRNANRSVKFLILQFQWALNTSKNGVVSAFFHSSDESCSVDICIVIHRVGWGENLLVLFLIQENSHIC